MWAADTRSIAGSWQRENSVKIMNPDRRTSPFLPAGTFWVCAPATVDNLRGRPYFCRAVDSKGWFWLSFCD